MNDENVKEQRKSRAGRLAHSRATGYCRVADVMELLDCEESTAYQIMRRLNKEIEAAGRFTFSGRVLKSYLLYRVGLAAQNPFE